MEFSLLAPPVALLVVFVVVLFEHRAAGALQLDATWPEEDGKREHYACGEDVTGHTWQTDYGQFFPFAFFFTIMHVVALVVATTPRGDLGAMAIALTYLVASVIALFILFRR